MKTEQFLEHHGIAANPFSEEDAQTDTVFKRRCLVKIHHPAWNKFFGSPADPSTALVFGEKGSGKTALRLQAVAELDAYNEQHPTERVFVISYDDFNPYLDHFKASVRARDTVAALGRWRLQDHMDAIMAQGVTQLVDSLSAEKIDLSVLSVDQRRDLLLLAALYDQSTGEPIERRWSRLRRRSGFRPLWSRRDLQIGFGITLVVLALIAFFPRLRTPSLLLPVVAGWAYWAWRLARAEWFAREIRKGLRVLSRDPAALRWELLWFKPSELGGQPLPTASRTGGEERYELLRKFQGVLHTLGYSGIIVLVDRVDEPQQVEGDPRKMRALIWPLLDHKFLRHPGIGIKLLLPIELAYYLEKEDKDFYDRARPDKLNMIKPLRWTGPSLYDLAGDRLRACALTPSNNGDGPRLRQFVDDAIGDDSLKDALGNLRTPRQLFKFLHRLIEEHCHRHTEDNPVWSVDADTFRTTYSSYMRDLEAFDRGYGHGSARGPRRGIIPMSGPPRTPRLIAFHKPYDVLTQFSGGDGRATLKAFIDVPGVYPVGRLDRDSEGLLLLTDDGRIAHVLTDPRFEHPKTYLVQVERVPDQGALDALRNGVVLRDGRTKPAGVEGLTEPPDLPERSVPIRFRKNVPTAWIRLVIREGRNRQVRRMTAAVGYPTLRLVRVAVGPVQLGDLAPGRWRDLNPAERVALPHRGRPR